MSRAIRFLLGEEGQVLLRQCDACQAGTYMKLALLALECDQGGQILIGGFEPVEAQFAAVCGLSESEMKAVRNHLQKVGLLTPNGRVSGYRKMVAQDRREYQQVRHKLEKTHKQLLPNEQGAHSGQQSARQVGKAVEGLVSNFSYTDDYEKADFGTKFTAWFMFVWNCRRPTPMEMMAATEFAKKYGWAKLKAAMMSAAKQGHRWWAVEKNLTGEWNSPRGKPAGRISRHTVDKD